MRGAPHSGFAVAMRVMRALTSAWGAGRPPVWRPDSFRPVLAEAAPLPPYDRVDAELQELSVDARRPQGVRCDHLPHKGSDLGMDARTASGWPTRAPGRSLLAESRRLRRAHRVAGALVGRVRVVARRRDLVDAITAVVVAGVARERALAGRHGEPIDAVALRDVAGARMLLPQDMKARVTV